MCGPPPTSCSAATATGPSGALVRKLSLLGCWPGELWGSLQGWVGFQEQCLAELAPVAYRTDWVMAGSAGALWVLARAVLVEAGGSKGGREGGGGVESPPGCISGSVPAGHWLGAEPHTPRHKSQILCCLMMKGCSASAMRMMLSILKLLHCRMFYMRQHQQSRTQC